MFRLETCMSSLVKVPPYSKWNFQGKIVFNPNWCNITLNILRKILSILVKGQETMYNICGRLMLVKNCNLIPEIIQWFIITTENIYIAYHWKRE